MKRWISHEEIDLAQFSERQLKTLRADILLELRRRAALIKSRENKKMAPLRKVEGGWIVHAYGANGELKKVFIPEGREFSTDGAEAQRGGA